MFPQQAFPTRLRPKLWNESDLSGSVAAETHMKDPTRFGRCSTGTIILTSSKPSICVNPTVSTSGAPIHASSYGSSFMNRITIDLRHVTECSRYSVIYGPSMTGTGGRLLIAKNRSAELRRPNGAPRIYCGGERRRAIHTVIPPLRSAGLPVRFERLTAARRQDLTLAELALIGQVAGVPPAHLDDRRGVARKRTRTSTALRPLDPEPSVSTNFTIRARRTGYRSAPAVSNACSGARGPRPPLDAARRHAVASVVR